MKTMSRICLFALLLSVGGTFTSCDFINEKRNQYFSSSNSNSLVGEWVEVSEDDYLVGHYQFYSDGSGKFWLTDGIQSEEDSPSHGSKMASTSRYSPETAVRN